MLPLIATIPASMDITLGLSLVVPALLALAVCGAALLYAVTPRVRTAVPTDARPQLWSPRPSPVACGNAR